MLLLLVARVFVALDSLYFTCVIVGIATGINAAAKSADVAMRPIQLFSRGICASHREAQP